MMKNMYRAAGLSAVTLAIFAPHAAATNGDHMLGLSAIQNGMAGAVVAAPQDAATVLRFATIGSGSVTKAVSMLTQPSPLITSTK